MEGVVNRCDYRKHVTPAALESCRDANEEHSSGFDDSCDAHADKPFADPLDTTPGMCWTVTRFADPDSVPPSIANGGSPPPPSPSPPPPPPPSSFSCAALSTMVDLRGSSSPKWCYEAEDCSSSYLRVGNRVNLCKLSSGKCIAGDRHVCPPSSSPPPPSPSPPPPSPRPSSSRPPPPPPPSPLPPPPLPSPPPPKPPPKQTSLPTAASFVGAFRKADGTWTAWARGKQRGGFATGAAALDGLRALEGGSSPPPPPPKGVQVLDGGARLSPPTTCIDPTSAVTAVNDRLIAAQCCDKDGGACRRFAPGKQNDEDGCIAGFARGKPPQAMTYAAAQSRCSALGLAMCENSCAGTGCLYNQYPVFTSLECELGA